MSPEQILKEQVKELEKLIDLKCQTISHLELELRRMKTYPFSVNPHWTVTSNNIGNTLLSNQNGLSTQMGANQA